MASPLSNVLHLPAPKRRTRPLKRLPTEAEILAIPLSYGHVFDLNDVETKRLRSQLYSINRENVAGFKYRTMREGTLLNVWRIR